jgi:hypothetical protein
MSNREKLQISPVWFSVDGHKQLRYKYRITKARGKTPDDEYLSYFTGYMRVVDLVPGADTVQFDDEILLTRSGNPRVLPLQRRYVR